MDARELPEEVPALVNLLNLIEDEELRLETKLAVADMLRAFRVEADRPSGNIRRLHSARPSSLRRT